MSISVYLSPKGTPVTDSRRVAKAFEKTHSVVLRALSNLGCDEEFSRNNFAPSTYKDRRGKVRRQVVMTKAGFAYLVLGFTGQKAADFKVGFIAQFDRMQEQLSKPKPTATPLTDFNKLSVQLQQVKATAAHIFRIGDGPGDLMAHHRGVMKYLTGCTPSEYVRAAVARGLRVRSLSGRELLRRLQPAKAATAAFMDEQVQRGKTLDQLAAAGIPDALAAAFASMLRAGISPAELSDS